MRNVIVGYEEKQHRAKRVEIVAMSRTKETNQSSDFTKTLEYQKDLNEAYSEEVEDLKCQVTYWKRIANAQSKILWKAEFGKDGAQEMDALRGQLKRYKGKYQALL